MIGRFAKYLLIVLLAVVMALLLPVIIPLAAFLSWRDRVRLKRIARESPCPTCGTILGQESIDRGDAAWRERMSQLHRDSEWGIRRRIVRNIHAVCPRCGTAHNFVAETGRFVPADISPPPSPSLS